MITENVKKLMTRAAEAAMRGDADAVAKTEKALKALKALKAKANATESADTPVIEQAKAQDPPPAAAALQLHSGGGG